MMPSDMSASYHRIQGDMYERIFANDPLVMVVKTRLVSEEPIIKQGHEKYYGREDIHITQHFELDIIETIKGTPPKDLSFKSPKMLEHAVKQQEKIGKTERSFSFWDGLLLSDPRSLWAAQTTSCGNLYERALAPDQYYLAIGSSNYIEFFEPISDANHSLVLDMKKIISRISPNKLMRKPEGFFRNIEGYSVVTFDKCPKKQDMEYGMFPSVYSKTKLKPYVKFEESFNKSAIFSVADFYSHQTGYGGFREGVCSIGDQYLTLYKTVHNPSNQEFSFYSRTVPTERYLKIVNGSVDVTHVKSNIKITGPSLVPVETVKSWIREANPK